MEYKCVRKYTCYSITNLKRLVSSAKWWIYRVKSKKCIWKNIFFEFLEGRSGYLSDSSVIFQFRKLLNHFISLHPEGICFLEITENYNYFQSVIFSRSRVGVSWSIAALNCEAVNFPFWDKLQLGSVRLTAEGLRCFRL